MGPQKDEHRWPPTLFAVAVVNCDPRPCSMKALSLVVSAFRIKAKIR